MGTTVELLVDGTGAHVRQAVQRIEALEQCWSRFRADSELNRLHARTDRWVVVSDDLCRAVRAARYAHTITGGRFDPTIRSALERLGYDRTFGDIAPDTLPTATPEPAPGFECVGIDGDRVYLPGSVAIDLGGIGKGLAADIVAGELVADGATAAVVSLGGDLCARGEAPDGGWPVPIVHPVTAATVAVHHLHEGALAMSTTALRTWTVGGRRVHHLIDPATGTSAACDAAALAVGGPSAAQAEALAKAALIAGRTEGDALLDELGVERWWIASPIGPHR